MIGVGTPNVAVLTIMSDTRAANDMALSRQSHARPPQRAKRIN
jgi:hypothetical protein